MIKNLVVLTALVGAQAASAGVILSDNLGNAPAIQEVVNSTRWVGASFTTDANSYTLGNVILRMSASATNAIGEVDLYSDSSNAPGSSLGTLIPPASFTTSLAQNTFGGNALPLSSLTTYWIVLRTLDANSSFLWTATFDDTGAGSGFTHTWSVTGNGGGQWSVQNTQTVMMQVNANLTAAPEPATFGLVLLSCIGAVVIRRR